MSVSDMNYMLAYLGITIANLKCHKRLTGEPAMSIISSASNLCCNVVFASCRSSSGDGSVCERTSELLVQFEGVLSC